MFLILFYLFYRYKKCNKIKISFINEQCWKVEDDNNNNNNKNQIELGIFKYNL